MLLDNLHFPLFNGQMDTITPQISTSSLLKGNCLSLMDKLIKDGYSQFELIFADPPYFLSNGGITCKNGKMVTVNKGDWDKSKGPDINHQFNTEWLRRCQSLLTDNGTIMVSGTHHVIYSVGFAMQQLGMKILNNITWEKPNPPPNLACRYLTHSTETIIWAAKNAKSKHCFNYDLMKQINGGKQMKDVWSFTAPGKKEKLLGNHPTQKPLALLERLILAASKEGDRVLDPFCGSGTTGVACMRTNRQFLGMELDEDFIQLAQSRLSNEEAGQ